MKFGWLWCVAMLIPIIGCGTKEITPVKWPYSAEPSSSIQLVECSLGDAEIPATGFEAKVGDDLPLKVVFSSTDLLAESAYSAKGGTEFLDVRKLDSNKNGRWQLFVISAGMKGSDESAVESAMKLLTGNVSKDRRSLEFAGRFQLPKSPGTYDFRLILLRPDNPIEVEKPLPVERGVLRSTIRVRNDAQ